jgi:hypothetical protein
MTGRVARCRACGGTLLCHQDAAAGRFYGWLVPQPYTACPTDTRSAT